MPAPTKHALLSASSADRWMHCPGSVTLTRDMPEKASEYAEEGQLAHAIAELKLHRHLGRDNMSQRTYTTRLNKLKQDPHYQPEMDGYTTDYLDYVTNIAYSYDSLPYIAIEQMLDLSAYIPEGYGTADCIIIHGPDLHVIDLKYGKGVLVQAEDNLQLKLYALGALNAYQSIWDIRHVHMSIVQPRGDGIKEATISADNLLIWGNDIVRPAAERAYNGSDEYNSGPWCRWCKAQATCRKHAVDVTSAIEDFGGTPPAELSMDELGDLLGKIDPLIKYAEAAKSYAQDTLMQGGQIKGWKLVEGRSKRVWDDQKAAFAALEAAGIDNALLWHKEPYTIAQLEAQLGKKTLAAAAGDHVIKRPGAPTLAPQSDKRQAYIPRPSAEDDFNHLNNEGDQYHGKY